MNIFNLSFGKDSMATLILAAEQGIPIDRVMYCDIRFSPELSGEHPLMAAWIPTAERRLKELFCVTVEHLYYGKSFVEMFYQPLSKGKFLGCNKGFPMTRSAWCNHLKVDTTRRAYSKIKKAGEIIVEYDGIAFDEPKRWERMRAKESPQHHYRSLLHEQHLTEQDAFEICRRYDLLSPMYTSGDGIYRGGCWFCPKQCYADLYALWRQYPNLYQQLLALEPDSHISFKPRGVTLKWLAERFENGYIPTRRKKRLPYVQLDMFDMIGDGQ